MDLPGEQIRMSVLVVDDDAGVLRSVERHLGAWGHLVHTARSGAEGVAILGREAIDIVVTDVLMPGMDGFGVLREARRISPRTETIMITAHGDIEGAVRAMREGAFDYFTKPLKLEDLQASLHRTARYHGLRREKERYQQRLARLREEARRCHGLSAIIGESAAIRNVKELIEQVARTDATTVLIEGETGTGKELVARAVHAESQRAEGPFEAVDSFTASLVESELFGHERGAFTDAREARRGHFELADGGTLFLDEAANMDLAVQGKLLRALEERRIRRVGGEKELPVDVRVISATNQDLRQAVARGTFREDLFYRLNVFMIRTPPLRERKEDVLPIARHFLRRYAREHGRSIEGFAPQAEALLQAHSFPGNVRELRNWIERAAILSKSRRITLEDLECQRDSGARPFDPTRLGDLDLPAIERAVVREALRRAGENQTRAARLLNITRRQLFSRMKGLDP
jgi:two-component system response regulator AtoC